METFLSIIYRLGGGLLFLVLGVFSVFGTSATAQAGLYIPTIWFDPDGCAFKAGGTAVTGDPI
jgi:hypothetical protein